MKMYEVKIRKVFEETIKILAEDKTDAIATAENLFECTDQNGQIEESDAWSVDWDVEDYTTSATINNEPYNTENAFSYIEDEGTVLFEYDSDNDIWKRVDEIFSNDNVTSIKCN